jgi:hypothetical protein
LRRIDGARAGHPHYRVAAAAGLLENRPNRRVLPVSAETGFWAALGACCWADAGGPRPRVGISPHSVGVTHEASSANSTWAARARVGVPARSPLHPAACCANSPAPTPLTGAMTRAIARAMSPRAPLSHHPKSPAVVARHGRCGRCRHNPIIPPAISQTFCTLPTGFRDAEQRRRARPEK